MGENLAEEVQEFIYQWCYKSLERLSFVGHSLGGVIIRGALPYLEEYKDKMYSFMSLSSPHLGFLYGGGFLVKTGKFQFFRLLNFLGLSVFEKWSKAKSLK